MKFVTPEFSSESLVHSVYQRITTDCRSLRLLRQILSTRPKQFRDSVGRVSGPDRLLNGPGDPFYGFVFGQILVFAKITAANHTKLLALHDGDDGL
jgi:hypothetical protein